LILWPWLVSWIAVGLLGLGWSPKSHSSLTRRQRAVLFTILIGMLALLGPLGLVGMVQAAERERERMR
jgi:hypothetical protein